MYLYSIDLKKYVLYKIFKIFQYVISKLLSTFDLFLFAEQSQRQIHLTLKEEAFTTECLSNTPGIYIMQPNIKNGKSYWINKNGQKAIWYLPKGLSKRGNRWIIGFREQIGKAFGNIASPDDVAEPQEATTWEFFDGTTIKSLSPGDVILTNILNSKNFISINIKSKIILMDH